MVDNAQSIYSRNVEVVISNMYHVVHNVYIIDTSIEVAVLPLVPHAP